MDSWKWLWKINIPQRYKTFLWLTLWDRLLTNANRGRRQLTNYPLCPLCEMEYETTEHALRSCPEAASVWQWFHSQGMGKLDDHLDFKNWVKQNILNNELGEDWGMKFATII